MCIRDRSNNGSRKTLSVDGHSTVDDATFGAFTLPANLLQQIEDAEPFPLTSTPPALAANGTVSNGVYWTGDPANPQIGDEKMEFFIVPSPIDITVVAQQTGTTFTAYQTESDLDKQLIFVGALSKDEAVAAEQSSGRFDRWALRALSFFFSLLGFATLLRSAATGFSSNSFLRSLKTGGTMVTALLASITSLSLLIAISWFGFQPLFSALLFGLAVVAVGTAVIRIARRNQRDG